MCTPLCMKRTAVFSNKTTRTIILLMSYCIPFVGKNRGENRYFPEEVDYSILDCRCDNSFSIFSNLMRIIHDTTSMGKKNGEIYL